MSDIKFVPQNVGIIMDGNGRWAEAQGLPRKDGHTAGMVNMIRVAAKAFDLGAKNVVCYSLSTENFTRKKDELDHILSLVLKYFDAFLDVFIEKKVCAKIVGNLDMLPDDIRASLKRTESILSQFESLGRTIYIAIAYGSRDEIVSAINRAVRRGEPVSEESFLCELDLPMNLDFVIRTGGEMRLSNFFLYQLSYAELYFSDKYFPDFSEADVEAAFDSFATRKRRYGK